MYSGWAPGPWSGGCDDARRQVRPARRAPARKEIPAAGTRVTCYTPNEIDLLQVRQTTGWPFDDNNPETQPPPDPCIVASYPDAINEPLSSYTYNDKHQTLAAKDAANQTTTYTYLPDGRLETIVTPPRNGPDGLPLTVAERTTTYLYYPDEAPTGGWRVHTITGPSTPEGSPVTSYTYDVFGRMETVKDSEEYILTYGYDALDRMTTTAYPDGTFEETVYERLDAVRKRDRLGRWTHTFYDAVRRPIATRDPAGRTTTQEWCSCGSLDKLVDPNGNATRWERDLQGRVKKEIRADNKFWEYTYETTTSRLKKVKDGKDQEIEYTYFADNQLQQVHHLNAEFLTPDVSFTYDPAFPRPATVVDGTGITSFTYHPIGPTPPLGAGRRATVDGPYANDTITYGYDELGRVASRTLGGVTSTWTYDALGRLDSQGDPIGIFEYTYVGVTDRLERLTYPNSQTSSYAYYPNTGNHRLQDIHHRTGGGATLSRFAYGYDAVGNIKTWTQQYGAAANAYDLGYDRADQLTAARYRTTDPTPALLKRYAYGYDPAGNRTTEQIDDSPAASVYNNMNRLMSQDGGGGLTFKGTLSEGATVTVQGKPATVGVDNGFERKAQAAPGTNTVAVVATDPSDNVRTNTYEMTVAAGPKSFIYDDNGSLSSSGTRTYEWDGQNRLTRALDGGSEIARFSYDGYGRRAQKIAGGVTRTYIYDGQNILEERLSTGSTIRYVHGPGLDQLLASVDSTGAVSYNLADHLGSTVQATSSGAQVTLTRQYDPYGNLLSGGAASGVAFTGREWDAEMGLYYYRARYYAADLGKFLSEDPILSGTQVSSALALANAKGNRYAYVMNNPISYVDPLGLVRWKCQISVLTVTPRFLGGGGMVGECTSECAGNRRVSAVLIGALAGGSRSKLPYSLSVSSYELVDPFPYALGLNLAGLFTLAGGGLGLGPGVGCAWVTLGSAVSIGSGCSGSMPLHDAGVGSFSGAAVLTSQRAEDCRCP